ncbi:hypothetical protein M3O75_15645 [Klebsiella pneumoniae]|nr:hypothetical protein [Klebsiella pneumoniae]
MQEIFPTRLMDATGRLYSERASLVRRSKRSSFPLFNSPEERSDCRRRCSSG